MCTISPSTWKNRALSVSRATEHGRRASGRLLVPFTPEAMTSCSL